MNAFGHLIAASWEGSDPRYLLGAMLPDLATLVGGRIGSLRDPHLADGVRHHHATDAVFHALPGFTDWWSLGTDELRAAGLRRHAARAAAHVGIELLLDGELAHEAEADGLHASGMAAAREMPEPTWRQRPNGSWRELIERLERAGAPRHLRDPDVTSRRVGAALARRPRLKLEESEGSRVTAWLRAASREAAARTATIVDQLRSGSDQREGTPRAAGSETP